MENVRFIHFDFHEFMNSESTVVDLTRLKKSRQNYHIKIHSNLNSSSMSSMLAGLTSLKFTKILCAYANFSLIANGTNFRFPFDCRISLVWALNAILCREFQIIIIDSEVLCVRRILWFWFYWVIMKFVINTDDIEVDVKMENPPMDEIDVK